MPELASYEGGLMTLPKRQMTVLTFQLFEPGQANSRDCPTLSPTVTLTLASLRTRTEAPVGTELTCLHIWCIRA
jgi:hypothetical protein